MKIEVWRAKQSSIDAYPNWTWRWQIIIGDITVGFDEGGGVRKSSLYWDQHPNPIHWEQVFVTQEGEAR